MTQIVQSKICVKCCVGYFIPCDMLKKREVGLYSKLYKYKKDVIQIHHYSTLNRNLFPMINQ